MKPVESVCLAHVKENQIHVNDTYHIEITKNENSHLLIRVPVEIGTSAANFYHHPNIIGIKRQILNLKHYHGKRGKFWTSKPGLMFYFAVPKDKIFVRLVKGYSTIELEINDQVYHLSVSGGTRKGGGWVDVLAPSPSTYIYTSAKKLQRLADVAEIIDTEISIGEMSDFEKEEYLDLCASKVTPKKLKEGSKIYLKNMYTIQGSNGPFVVSEKRKNKKSFVVYEEGQYCSKVTYKYVNWTRTAKANKIDLSAFE
jgi:hypothetical protein